MRRRIACDIAGRDWIDIGDSLAREDEREGNGCHPYDPAAVVEVYREVLAELEAGDRARCERDLLAGYAARARSWPRDSDGIEGHDYD